MELNQFINLSNYLIIYRNKLDSISYSQLRECISFLVKEVDDQNIKGKKLCFRLGISEILNKEISENLLEIVDLLPGWYENEGEYIHESIYTITFFLLIIFYLLDLSPNYLVASPEQTINFKYNKQTLIIDNKKEELCFFNQEEYKINKYSIKDLCNENNMKEMLEKEFKKQDSIINELVSSLFKLCLQMNKKQDF